MALEGWMLEGVDCGFCEEWRVIVEPPYKVHPICSQKKSSCTL